MVHWPPTRGSKGPLNHLVWVHLYTFYEPLRTPSPGHHQDDGGQAFWGVGVSRTKPEIGCHCYWVGGGRVDPSDPFLLWDAISRMPPFAWLGFLQKKTSFLLKIWQWKNSTIWVIWCVFFVLKKNGKNGKRCNLLFFCPSRLQTSLLPWRKVPGPVWP